MDGKDGIMTEAQIDAAHKQGKYPKIRAPNFLQDLFAGAAPQPLSGVNNNNPYVNPDSTGE